MAEKIIENTENNFRMPDNNDIIAVGMEAVLSAEDIVFTSTLINQTGEEIPLILSSKQSKTDDSSNT